MEKEKNHYRKISEIEFPFPYSDCYTNQIALILCAQQACKNMFSILIEEI